METIALAQCFAAWLAAFGPMAAPTSGPLWDGNTLPCRPASPVSSIELSKIDSAAAHRTVSFFEPRPRRSSDLGNWVPSRRPRHFHAFGRSNLDSLGGISCRTQAP